MGKLHRTLIGGDRDAKNTCEKCGHVKENGTVSIICPKPECQSMKWVLDDPDAIDGLKIKVSEVCGDCNSHIWDTAKAEWRKIEGFSKKRQSSRQNQRY